MAGRHFRAREAGPEKPVHTGQAEYQQHLQSVQVLPRLLREAAAYSLAQQRLYQVQSRNGPETDADLTCISSVPAAGMIHHQPAIQARNQAAGFHHHPAMSPEDDIVTNAPARLR